MAALTDTRHRLVSVVIPNRNGAATIGLCLQSALACRHPNFEVIVVDDASTDDSVAQIERFACRLVLLVRLHRHTGAAGARNAGAQHARGELLFFTDADCLLGRDTLNIAVQALAQAGPDAIVGGSYTAQPYDSAFCSRFQSAFIRHSETRRPHAPDYLATHALAIARATFWRHHGFDEAVRPILEDVEFSHRARRAGSPLVMNAEIAVQHIFNFTPWRSLRNAFVKSLHWTRYGLRHGDLLADSGTASHELKINVAAGCFSALAGSAFLAGGAPAWLVAALLVQAGNALAQRRLLAAFYCAGGMAFAGASALYYFLVYPWAVGAGAMAGLLRHGWEWARHGARRMSDPSTAAPVAPAEHV